MSTQSCSFTTVCILSDQALQCCTIRAGKTGNRRCCLLPCFDRCSVEQAMRPTMAANVAEVACARRLQPSSASRIGSQLKFFAWSGARI